VKDSEENTSTFDIPCSLFDILLNNRLGLPAPSDTSKSFSLVGKFYFAGFFAWPLFYSISIRLKSIILILPSNSISILFLTLLTVDPHTIFKTVNKSNKKNIIGFAYLNNADCG
jgi:hypothetical protein